MTQLKIMLVNGRKYRAEGKVVVFRDELAAHLYADALNLDVETVELRRPTTSELLYGVPSSQLKQTA